ncbi:MAG: PAS domain-containing protein [Cyanobacteria bacterium SZAS LIN-5]|nr:PAS domain-containing protein [Cyanobacteria bacterium SZAS LIN-5]
MPEVNETTLQLSAPDNQLRILAEAIPQMVWTSDARGNVQYANKQWYEYTGLSYDQTRNMHWLVCVHPDDAQSTREAWLKAVETGNIYEVTHRLKGADNSYRWHLSRALPVKNKRGDLENWFGTSTDIEDQRQASERMQALLESSVQERTEALEIARDEAIRASSLKSQFVQNISHEIRTPMSGILGMSELLAEMELPSDAREMANHILTAAGTLMEIVNDLLDFSKLDANKVALQKSKFSLSELIESVTLSISCALGKKNLNLIVDVQEGLPDSFMGDEKKIRQVLLNILNNAVKFTESGDIKLSIAEQARTENWYSLRFSIVDQGIGIGEETLPKLFEPFVQADGSITRRYGGTGLGLSICRKLVNLMSGEIGVESKVGSGSTFWFMIPLEAQT